MIDRRLFLAGSGAVLLGNAKRAVDAALGSPFSRIEARLGPGGRLGVAALNTGTGELLTHRPNERFALCSTFKLALAAAWLARVEHGLASLGEQISFSAADLTDYSPVTRVNVGRGRLSVEQLCAAVVEVSDNGAANLLLRPLGGPAGFTRLLRGWGDSATRLDRFEEQLNTNMPGDPRDTTTPAAMLGLMRRLLVSNALTPASRGKLIGWMRSATAGLNRLRSGVPPNWIVGDKTGNGRNGAANDLAIAWPTGHSPILIASYMSGGTADRAQRDAAHASVAAEVVQAFGFAAPRRA
jgi:beta-lactamase class A